MHLRNLVTSQGSVLHKSKSFNLKTTYLQASIWTSPVRQCQVSDFDSDTNIKNDYQQVDEDNNNFNGVIKSVEVEEEKDDPDEPIFMPPEQEKALLDQLKKFMRV